MGLLFNSIDKGLDFNRNLLEILQVKLHGFESGPDRATVVLLLFASNSIEHHAAIQLLITQRRIGSAAALMRPFLESSFKGFWVKRVAKDAEIVRFLQGRDIFPTFARMCKQLNEAFPSQASFHSAIRRYGEYSDFIHSAAKQLSGRFKLPNVIGDAYTDAAIIDLLEHVYVNLLFVSCVTMEALDREPDGHNIMNWHKHHFGNIGPPSHRS